MTGEPASHVIYDRSLLPVDKTKPNCKYVLSSNEFGERFAIGYAKRLLLDLKKRMSAKQTKKAKALAIELKASIT